MRRATLPILAIAAAVMTAPAIARAQDGAPSPPSPADAALVPPRLVTPLSPSYPDGGEGDASVVLAVTVGPDGNVRDVRVASGAEPFATQAIATVEHARFVPASREGVPVAATIRFQIDFTKPKPPPPPEPEPEPEPTPPPSSPIDPKKPEPPKVQDVFVRGGRSTVASTAATDTLARAEVRQLPGAFGDPFRAIEIAPGLSPVITGLPYFYVRGAPPGNVGYFYDGVRVPYLFHFGLGPAVIHPALISRTDLHKGGYPAAFGRYAGGIVDATSMPPSDRTHGEALIRAIDAGALIEAPFANGRGSALAAGRWSYTAALFTLLQSDTTLDYRDYQSRVSYAVSDRDTISLLAFGAYDLASQRELVDPATVGIAPPTSGNNANERREITRVLFASEFHRADVRWDRTLGGGGHMRVAGTVGYDRTRVEARRAAEDVMTGLRLDLVQPLSKEVLLRAGGDVVVDRYSGDSLPRFADDDDVVDRQQAVFDDRTDFATGVRVDTVLNLLPRIEVVPGARLDVFGSGGQRAVSVDPRLAARIDVTDKLRFVHAYGLATQAPSTPVVLPAIGIARLQGGLQRAVQTSFGVERDLPSDFTATAAVFHNAFYDLNDALGTAQVEIIDIERSDTLLEKSRGSAYGLELGVRRKLTQRLTGLVAYTLSRSERTQNGKKFLSAYDRPHVVNAVASYDLGRGWRAGGRFVFYSGVPTIAGQPAFPEQVVAVPPERTPPFLRLDLRVEKRWRIGERAWVSVVLEALNATLSKEVTGYRCGTALALPGQTRPTPRCVERTVGPVSVPSLGVEGGF